MKLSNLTLEYVKNLSRRYDIPTEDIILIALNALGLNADISNKRIRFNLKLDGMSEPFYFAVCVNINYSPFRLEGNDILFNGEKIGKAIDKQNDTCDSTYFRRDKTVLTLNSNSRSQCKGCKFCGTYDQDALDQNNLLTKESLREHLEKEVIIPNKVKDLSFLREIGICTGCFSTEQKALEHFKMVREVGKEYNFTGEIKYIGLTVVSKEGLDFIQSEILPFSYYLTVECFTRRDQILKPSKAQILPHMAREIMDWAQKREIDTTFLYIAGLDPKKVVIEEFKKMIPHITRFPIINVFQNYQLEHESLRLEEAKHIEYYLDVRKGLEEIFKPTKFRPRSWENYRGLWYSTFADEKKQEVKI